MSADNWAICPRCKVREDEEKNARAQAADDAYGKVSAGQYLNLVNAAKVSVECTGCVAESDSFWFFGPYGFELTSTRPLPFVGMAGKLGIRDCEQWVTARLHDSLGGPV